MKNSSCSAELQRLISLAAFALRHDGPDCWTAMKFGSDFED